MSTPDLHAQNIRTLTDGRTVAAAYLHTWSGAELARYVRPRIDGLTLHAEDRAPMDLTAARVSTVVAGATHTVLTLSLPAQARTLTLLVEYPAA